MTVGTEMKHKPSGFTLVELLVVIAVIAVLTSLLLPSLNRAKETSRSAVCRNNMHQILLGMLLYTDDNNDFYPWAGGTNRNYLPDWVFGGYEAKIPPDPKEWVQPEYANHAESGSIFYYVTSNPRVLPYNERFTNSFLTYRCPSSGVIGRYRRVTYGMNGWFDPIDVPELKPQGVQRSAVVSPSQKIILVDGSPITANGCNFRPAGLNGTSQFQAHNTRVNMGFVDDHLESFRYQRMVDIQGGRINLTRGYFDPFYRQPGE